MGLNAGDLRERIVLITTAGPPVATGRGYKPGGADIEQTLWARVKPLGVKEQLLNGQTVNAETFEITVRSLHPATGKQRIRWRDKTLNVLGMRPAETKDFQLLTCINGGQ